MGLNVVSGRSVVGAAAAYLLNRSIVFYYVNNKKRKKTDQCNILFVNIKKRGVRTFGFQRA